jgi:hypothetical protein
MKTRNCVILAAFGFLALAVSFGIRTINHDLATSKPDLVNLPVLPTLGSFNHATISWPDGSMHRFVVGRKAQGELHPKSYEGVLTLTASGKVVYDQSFALETATPCDWLKREHLEGLIIPDMESWRTISRIPKDTVCDLQIVMEPASNGDLSLWLSYVSQPLDPQTSPEESHSPQN